MSSPTGSMRSSQMGSASVPTALRRRRFGALDTPVADIIGADGDDGLMRLPGIGESLARTIARLARSRQVPLLERLRRDTMPEAIFATVPGIGREMATRIHEATGVETLSDLEAAAYDGRLSRVPGIGTETDTGRAGIAGVAISAPPYSTPQRDGHGPFDRADCRLSY